MRHQPTLHFWYKPGADGTSSADFQRVLLLTPVNYDLIKELTACPAQQHNLA